MSKVKAESAPETARISMRYDPIDDPGSDWQKRLAVIVDTMREISRQTDPQAMVRTYGKRIRQLMPAAGAISLSRRELTFPKYRITRSTTWREEINPWKEKDRLPLLEGGLLGELIYGDEPRIMDDLAVAAGDPAAPYLSGHRSLAAIPLYDQGVALNMVVLLREDLAAFSRERFPEMVWLSNLFGRATNNLVLSAQVEGAYTALDYELKMVADMQRSLLPAELPLIPTLDLAASYQPSRRAGGDYYDFFALPDGKWGILIADVSGHGTPAAVLMAITHCIAHMHPGPAGPPGAILRYVNHHLTARYTRLSETFVTAFYGIYDPAKKLLTYARAGHNPPRLKRCQDGTLAVLDGANGLPLGILPEQDYRESIQQLQTGDQIIFYTDGITEAHNPAGELFGTSRLDLVLELCTREAKALLDTVLETVQEFTAGQPAEDDRTVIIARVS
jgi:sigma-B regulation protein RsbU (phosphoserine phosphatase)